MKASTDSFPFQNGERVQYRVPVNSKSAQKYSWESRTGAVQGYDHLYELVQIQPNDSGQDVIQVAKCYVKKEVVQ